MKKLIYFLEEIIQSALPGKWLVDSIPVLQKLADWFPGTHFKQVAKKWRAEMDELANTPHEYVKSQLSAGTAIPSLTSSLLNEQDTAPEKEDMIKWAALTLYAAGMETSTSVSSGFFLAMALYPEVLRKAQEEVDSVIGHNRLPSILDRDQFPYVNAPLESYAGVSPLQLVSLTNHGKTTLITTISFQKVPSSLLTYIICYTIPVCIEIRIASVSSDS